jgi:hypothetical protein
MTWLISAACAVGTLVVIALILLLHKWLYEHDKEWIFVLGCAVAFFIFVVTLIWHIVLFG